MSQDQLQPIIALLRARQEQIPGSIAELREEFKRQMTKIPLGADITREDVEVDGIPGAWFTPPGAREDAAILYLHGGGYVIGSIDTHAALTGDIARAARMRTLSIDYRLAPEHPHPAAVEDAVAAYRWLLAQGYTAENLAIAGDSAGGGLALATLIALRDADIPLPRAAAMLSPWVDLEGKGESMTTRAKVDPMITPQSVIAFGRLYGGRDNLRAPLASPLHADLHGLPPLLIHVGTAEVLLDDAVRIAERAEAAGVEVTLEVYEGMIHVFQFFATIVDEGRESIQRIGSFLGLPTQQKQLLDGQTQL